MSKKPPSGGPYEVGYGKPPEKHKFRPGQSGNPNGRPKKGSQAKNIEAIFFETIDVKVNGKQQEVTAFEAGLRRIVQSAIKGNLNAIKEFLEICQKYDLLEPNTPAGGVIVAPKGVSPWELEQQINKGRADLGR